MKYTVTYVQEVAHTVEAATIEQAGDMAKRYADTTGNLRVLSVYPFYEMPPQLERYAAAAPLPGQPTNG